MHLVDPCSDVYCKDIYHEFEIQIPKVKVKSVNEEDNRIILTREQIQKAYDYANTKYKAVIVLMMSSGMGASEVIHLTVDDFLKGISKSSETARNGLLDIPKIRSEVSDNTIATWRIKRIKTNMAYTTFSSPESVVAILNYLEERKELKKSYTLFSSSKGEWAQTQPSFSAYFGTLNSKCKFGKQGSWNLFRSHNLRKFFATTLYRAGLNQLACDWMLGHSIEKVTGTYFLADDSHLQESYMKALPDITLTHTEAVYVESDDVKKIKTNLELMQKKLDKYDKLFADKQFRKLIESYIFCDCFIVNSHTVQRRFGFICLKLGANEKKNSSKKPC